MVHYCVPPTNDLCGSQLLAFLLGKATIWDANVKKKKKKLMSQFLQHIDTL